MIHQDNHQPLIDPVTWQRAQDVLAANLVGERQCDHPHYLKSSVFCGACGSRLIITNAKNRYGIVYPYSVCLGRHMKRTACTRKALLVAKIEKLVEDHLVYLIASEQQRITCQLAGIEERLSAMTARFDEIEANLAAALDLAHDCHAAYLAADPQLHRLFNQAFFTHLYIDDEGTRGEYAEPFDVLLDQGVLDAGEPSWLTVRPARSRWLTSWDGQ